MTICLNAFETIFRQNRHDASGGFVLVNGESVEVSPLKAFPKIDNSNCSVLRLEFPQVEFMWRAPYKPFHDREEQLAKAAIYSFTPAIPKLWQLMQSTTTSLEFLKVANCELYTIADGVVTTHSVES